MKQCMHNLILWKGSQMLHYGLYLSPTLDEGERHNRPIVLLAVHAKL